MTFMVNHTLKDVLDIYAHEVVELRRSVELARSREASAREEAERKQKRFDEEAKRSAALAGQLQAEKKRTAKLEGIIDTLKLELQHSRSAHTETGAELDSVNELLDRIYDALTDDGTEKAKVIMIHKMIIADRRDRRGHDDA